MYTIQDVSTNTLKIEALISASPSGKYFSYSDLQKTTGIQMDENGKSHLRSALRRLKMPYETIQGEGIRLLSPENASKIVVRSVVRIDNSIKKAEKTTKHVRNKVFNELTEDEKKNINFLSALFGTIRSYSTSAKRIFDTQNLKVGDKI